MQNSNAFFWTWFEQHSDVFIELPRKTRKEFDFWVRHLQVMLAGCCHRRVYANIEWQTEYSIPRLIITANGNYMYFNKVEDLVSKAPLSLPWEVMAFEPPRPLDFLIKHQFRDIGIDPGELYFLPLELYKDCKESLPILTVYLDIDTPPGFRHKQAVEAVVYNILGEKSAVLDLADIEVKIWSELTNRQQDEVASLDLLPNFILDLSPSTYVVTPSGKLKLRL